MKEKKISKIKKKKVGVYINAEGERAISEDGEVLFALRRSVGFRGIIVLLPSTGIGFHQIGKTEIDHNEWLALSNLYKVHSDLYNLGFHVDKAIENVMPNLDKYSRFKM